MKKNMFSLIFGACVALLLSGCCSDKAEKEYNIVLLGDIHYDKPEFHKMPKGKAEVPWATGARNENGLFLWRLNNKWMTDSCRESAQNYPKNARMWQKDVPEIIARAVVCGKQNNALYTFQLGDMIHGDCGNLELHKKNLKEALDYMTSRFHSPVLVACGNHDPRGPFGRQAWNEIMLPHFDRAAGNIQRKGTNFYMTIGKDFYYFHDAMTPDLDFLEQALQKNKNARYTFFVTHIPLITMGKSTLNKGLAENMGRLLSLLGARNAIVLSAHAHQISLSQYRDKGHRIDQFVINSTLRKTALEPLFDPAKSLLKKKFGRDFGGRAAMWNKYFEGKVVTPVYNSGSGHALLRVSDAGVFVDYQNFKQTKVYSWQLR